MKVLPSAVLLFFLIAGCAVAKQSEPAVSLEDTDWVLVELNGQAVEPTGSMKAPSLRFDRATGMVVGHSGVNHYGGGYTLKGDSIEFGPMRTTMMAGPPEAMEMETGFLKALNAVSGWRIEEGTLSLLEGDTVLARFTAEGPWDGGGDIGPEGAVRR